MNLSFLFIIMSALAIDEKDLLKDLLPEPTQQQEAPKKKKKKYRIEEIHYKSGFKSTVDQKCLQKMYEEAQFQVKIKHIRKWQKECRTEKTKGCRILGSMSDKECMAKVRNYYLFEFKDDEEYKLEKGCQVHQMSCPVDKETKERIITN